MNLIKRWQQGEVSAFEALFIANKDTVFRTALAMNMDGGEAEDVVQTVFLKAHQSKLTFNGDETGFRRWVCRIAVNACMDIHRKKRKDLRLERVIEQGFEPGTQEKAFDKQETEDLIWQAMDCLDDRHRAVVVMRYLHELSYDEIARTLAVPLGTVKSRLNTATRMMRSRLAEKTTNEV